MKPIFLLFIFTFLFGCVAEEKITPTWEVRTLNEELNAQHGKDEIDLSYPITDIGVEDRFATIANVPNVGGVFRQIAQRFADMTISNSDGREFEIEPVSYQFPQLTPEELSYIRYVTLKNVYLQILEHSSPEPDKANLGFIKKLEIYVRPGLMPSDSSSDDQGGATTDADGTLMQGDGGNTDVTVYREDDVLDKDDVPKDPFEGAYLVLSYDKSDETLGCDGKCISMQTHKMDWKELLSKHNTVTIQTRLVILEVPKTEMKLGGQVDFSVALNAPF